MADNQNIDIAGPDDLADIGRRPANDADLAAICAAMREHGIKHVTVKYGGSGDSEEVHEIDVIPRDLSLPDWVESKLCHIVETYGSNSCSQKCRGHGTLAVHPFDGMAELMHSNLCRNNEPMDVAAAVLPTDLRLRLETLGVTSIICTYSGCEGSGHIEGLCAEPHSVAVEGELAEEVEEFLYRQIPDGWEANEGGFGDCDLDVATGNVKLRCYRHLPEIHRTQKISWKWRRR